MSEIETITMTMREVDRLKVVEAVVDGRLMTWRAAERLGMSRREVERLAQVVGGVLRGVVSMCSGRAQSDGEIRETVVVGVGRVLGEVR